MRAQFILILWSFSLLAQLSMIVDLKDREPILSIEAGYAGVWRGIPSHDHTMIPVVKTGAVKSTAIYENRVIDRFANALRLGLWILPERKNSIQGRFFGLLNFKRVARAENSDGEIVVPLYYFDSYNWNQVNAVYTRYHTLINSFDASWIYQISMRNKDYFALSFSFGPRYIQFLDKQYMTAFVQNGISALGDTSTGLTKEKNYLGGLQAGLDFSNSPTHHFNWGIDLRGALYVNVVRQNYNYLTNNNTLQFIFQKKTRAREAQSLEITPYVQFLFGQMFAKISFQYLAIWNLAIAPRQFQFDHPITSTWIKSHIYLYTANISLGIDF